MSDLDPAEDDFWSNVDAAGDCWTWTGPMASTGYGYYNDRSGGRTHRYYAHAGAYWRLVGPTPMGFELDHVCRNRRCVNPDHLDPVTHAENLRRSPLTSTGKTHCPRGHAYDETNTLYSRRGNGQSFRMCRVCTQAFHRKYKARQREQARQEAPPPGG